LQTIPVPPVKLSDILAFSAIFSINIIFIISLK
jgi:hypothetical protein